MGTPEREKGKEEMPETIMTKNSPKFMSDPKSQIQEVQRTPNRINATKPLQLDISFSNYGKSKIEKKVLKVVRGETNPTFSNQEQT